MAILTPKPIKDRIRGPYFDDGLKRVCQHIEANGERCLHTLSDYNPGPCCNVHEAAHAHQLGIPLRPRADEPELRLLHSSVTNGEALSRAEIGKAA